MNIRPKMAQTRLFIFVVFLASMKIADMLKCDRKIDGIHTPNIPLEGRFWITVATLNRTEIIDQYMPNVRYNVTIEGKDSIVEGPQKFTRFLLTAENNNESLSAGFFDLTDVLLTQFSDKCPSAVTESSRIPKSDISVFWTSPPEGSGCIIISATVVENTENWFANEGGLTRTICEDPKALEDDPGPVLSECCACDEAKYEVTFEGLWSRNTHPKDFPSKGWQTRFSDVIGASHTVDYRFWQDEEMASKGLQQVAEDGSTRKLESELKDQSENIRTIIKARGITYPNVTGRTFAVFRVDRKHHLMSLVSMIVPSPDWFVGVSGLELCRSNCSWIDHKELNLYPFDAGTDDGITYTSPDSMTDPPEPIQRITVFYPNDSRTPFFDPTGFDMKPMAKLHLNRQRLYEKTCDESPVNNDNSGDENGQSRPVKNRACKTTQWSAWGPCPPTCRGKQLRQRHFKDPAAAKANNCTVTKTDRRSCRGNDPHCIDNENQGTVLDKEECTLSSWSAWSDCTATCGEAYKTRSRNFIYKKHRKHCRGVSRGPDLQQTIICQIDPCSDPEVEAGEDGNSTEENGDDEGETEDNEEMDAGDADIQWGSLEVTEEWLQKCPQEEYHNWSNWSPCTATCGSGTSVRSRLPIDESSNVPEDCKTQSINCTAEIIACQVTPEEATEICNEPVLIGDCDGRHNRLYFDSSTGECRFFQYSGCNGNRNNFHTQEDCQKFCIDHERRSPLKNFKVSISSVLSYSIPAPNQRGSKTKRDQYGNNNETDFNGIQSGSQVFPTSFTSDKKRADCRYTEWSDWTRCNGCRGYTYKRREILVHARNGGTRCPTKLLRKKKCHKLRDCNERNRRSVLSSKEPEHTLT